MLHQHPLALTEPTSLLTPPRHDVCCVQATEHDLMNQAGLLDSEEEEGWVGGGPMPQAHATGYPTSFRQVPQKQYGGGGAGWEGATRQQRQQGYAQQGWGTQFGKHGQHGQGVHAQQVWGTQHAQHGQHGQAQQVWGTPHAQQGRGWDAMQDGEDWQQPTPGGLGAIHTQVIFVRFD